MATEFNYKRAWEELANPYYESKIVQEARDLVCWIGQHGTELRQDSVTLDVPITDELKSRFEAIAPRDLALAARTIRDWGHWASGGKGPPHDWAGAHWKFANMADQVLRRTCGLPQRTARGQTGLFLEVHEGMLRACFGSPSTWTWEEISWATPELKAKAVASVYFKSHHYFSLLKDELSKDDQDKVWFYYDFMDHKEGSKFDNDELPVRCQSLVSNEFTIHKVRAVNHEPHPFCISDQHFDNGTINVHKAPCGFRALGSFSPCGLSYEQHTYEVVMFLELKKTLKNREAAEALTHLKEAFERDKVHVDGFAFLKSEADYTILPPEEKEGTECSDSAPGK